MVDDRHWRELAGHAAIYTIPEATDAGALAVVIPRGAEEQLILWVVPRPGLEVEVRAVLQRVGDPLLAGERVTVLPA